MTCQASLVAHAARRSPRLHRSVVPNPDKFFGPFRTASIPRTRTDRPGAGWRVTNAVSRRICPGSVFREHAARTARYTDAEIAPLSFEGDAPSAGELSRTWHAMLDEAREIVAALPPDRVGTCVLGPDDGLFRGGRTDLADALATDALRFRSGSIRGVLPTVRGA